jgi:hypothetical protein
LLLIIALIIITLSLPVVQTYIAKKVTTKLNKNFDTNINISRLGLNWKGEIDIKDVYIEDHHSDTLIYVKTLNTDLLSLKNLVEGDLYFGFIELNKAKFYIKTYKDEKSDNVSIFANKFNSTSPSSDKKFVLKANDIKFSDSNVKITNENLEQSEIFNLSFINIESEIFSIVGPNVNTTIKQLSLESQRGFDIKNLTGIFSYSLTSISIKQLKLKTDDSFINGGIIMNYKEGELSDFVNKVDLNIHFNEAKISTNDLNIFYNEFGLNQNISINGDLKGTLNNFTFSNGQIKSGLIKVLGDYNFINLLSNKNDFSIYATNHSISTNFVSLKQLMPKLLGEVLPKEISYLGRIKFNGSTTITKTYLTTSSTLISTLGSAKINASIHNLNDEENSAYIGDVDFTNFDLGPLANTESIGTITSKLNIEGVGFSQKSLNAKVTGEINSFVFENYNYKNITLSGNFKHPLFDGELNINDPNLKLTFNGLIDVSEKLNRFNFKANIEYAELNKLNLIKRDSISIFVGKIDINMIGNDLNNTYGSISFKETFYQTEKDDFYFNDFLITSKKDGLKRVIDINSLDIMTGYITGEFLIEDIPDLFINGVGSIYANFKPNKITENQYIDFDFEIYNKLIEIFVPQLEFGDDTRVKGSVYSNESKIKFDFDSPEIIVFKNYLGKVKFKLDNFNPLYNTYISVDTLYNGFYNLKDINFINKTINDTLHIGTNFSGGKNKDYFNLSLYYTIDREGNSVVGIKKSDIIHNDKTWYLNENDNKNNKIVFDNSFKKIKFDSIVLNHNDELIAFTGATNDSTFKNLKVRFNDVNIGNLIPKVDSLKLKGNINGNLSILQKKGVYFPSSNIIIDNINVNDIEMGDLTIDILGNNNLTRYDINTSLVNNNIKSLNSTGYIETKSTQTDIQLNIELNEFNLGVISPFGASVITNIRGLMSGKGRVLGNLNSPDMFGDFILKKSGLKVPYLNIDFDLEDTTKINITEEKLEISKTNITDTKYLTKGILTGNATHKNFGKWKLNLNVDSDNLLVLNTPPDENQSYYGTAFISGTTHIHGPINELIIDVNATTEKNTIFKIPLSNTETIGDNSFINFLSPKEKEDKLLGETIVRNDLKGLALNFELDINKNAEIEIVIDQNTKSALKGRGAGTLLIEINTLGKFNMWGDFIVYEGIYDFRYGKIIRKEIEVEKGGSITWDGLASNANLNLKAIYKTKANPSALLDDPSINRKIPVEVFIDLTENITQPNLLFDISFPDVSSTVRSELEYRLQTTEEREKQALFLLTTGSFISDTAGQSAVSGTVTDGINAILAQILTDDDAIINIAPYYDMGIDTKEIETQDEFGVQFSTQITERIVVNGKVGIPVGKINDSRVAGDVDVQWLVNEDGNLRINFFNRQAELQFIGEDQTFEQGAGISYQVDFDTIKELMNKIFGIKVELEEFIPEDNKPVNFKTGTSKN